MLNDYNISSEEYLKLYERFLSRPLDDLLFAGGPIKGKKVLDLCAGTLRLSNRAKELGASLVIALDKSKTMIPTEHKADHIVICSIEDMGRNYSSDVIFNHRPFDLIICQQAINYWFNPSNLGRVSSLIKYDGGHFVFNTFNTKPNTIPTIKSYKIDNEDVIETFQLVEDEVYHLQMRTGCVPHFTSFKWLEPEKINKTLKYYFKNIKCIKDKATSIYICSHKGD